MQQMLKSDGKNSKCLKIPICRLIFAGGKRNSDSMEKRIPFMLSLLLLTGLASSCIRDGEKLDDCTRRMRIELRWIETSPLNSRETVDIGIDPLTAGPQSNEAPVARRLKSDVYGVDVDMLLGSYNIIGWEPYSNVDLDNGNHTLKVHTQADGTAESPAIFSAGLVPAWESSAASEIIELPMYRQVRPLVIEINFIGDGYVWIGGVAGTLRGIALERAMTDAFPPVNGLSRPAAIEAGSTNYAFAPADNAKAGIWYTGVRNLIGVDGNSRQILDLTVSFTGDNEPASFEFDVTDQLAGFQTKNVGEPWYVVLTLNMGANLDVGVVDWLSGPESWITAR